jgi:hypothetical protein
MAKDVIETLNVYKSIISTSIAIRPVLRRPKDLTQKAPPNISETCTINVN